MSISKSTPVFTRTSNVGIETFIAALVGAGGIGTLIFAALRFQREDASAVVEQSGRLIAAMRETLDELEEALDRCRKERDQHRKEVEQLRRRS